MFTAMLAPRAEIASSPADDVLPVSTLSAGSYGANNFTGFTSAATTVSTTGGLKYIFPTSHTGYIATSRSIRDSEIKTYTPRGNILIRVSGTAGNQTGIYFRYIQSSNDIRIGIFTGFDATKEWDAQGAGFHTYPYYVNTNVSGSSEGIAAGFTNTSSPASTDHFTFGYRGFTVYLQWNGVDLLRYTEWRVAAVGQSLLWTDGSTGFRDVTAHYPSPASLYSNPSANSYDTRDFGMRALSAVTGSISAGSNQLTLSSSVGFQVGDQIIVEIGGESAGSLAALTSNTGGGLRNSIGVGGYWPTLSYANTTAMNADTGKTSQTWAYLPSNGYVYSWNGTIWDHRNDGAGSYNQGYYTEFVVPLSLVAKVTAVSGTTLTLDTNATAAATSANVYLDCLPSFIIINEAARSESVFPANPTGITISIPAGTWALSDIVRNSNTNIVVTNGLTIAGAGRTQTTLFSPKGTPCGAINLAALSASNVTIGDFKYIGNHGDNGYGASITTISGTAQSFFFPVAIQMAGGTNNTIQNIDGVNTFGGVADIGGTTPQLLNCTVNMQTTQHMYNGWQFSISDATGGLMSGCTGTSPYLLKTFEMFACNAAEMLNCGGQNTMISTNSSTSWTIDMSASQITVTQDSYSTSGPHWIGEPVISVNSHAFGGGGGGTIINPNITQSGYVNTSSFVYPPLGRTDYTGASYPANTSLKNIDVEASQTPTTIQGGYPLGGGGNGSGFHGLIVAPDYDTNNGLLGAIGVSSVAANTSVTGIRVKGAARGSPGLGGVYSNISLTGSSSSVTNCVADAIQSGPTQSGNQTNTAYGLP
jgi:hypothetical protein